MTFVKRKTVKEIVPVGTLKASRMGIVHGYFCTKCNYGMDVKKNIAKDSERCPSCGVSLNWNELV